MKNAKDEKEDCICGNPHFGFNCVCDHVRNNPGNNDYLCEFCGLYSASKPRCSKCELSKDFQDCLDNQATKLPTCNNH